ncbi:MAG: choline dehydrogenase, partial [Anaerolineae bacterium]|nr:choline dehydrogenase [Anaerolineae bacterium]
GFLRSRPGLDRPDLQLYFQPLTYENASPGVRALMRPDPFPGFSTSISPCRPSSRGHVAITSPDPLAPPRIEFKFLETAHDIDAMLYGVRLARKSLDQRL